MLKNLVLAKQILAFQSEWNIYIYFPTIPFIPSQSKNWLLHWIPHPLKRDVWKNYIKIICLRNTRDNDEDLEMNFV